MPRLLNPVQEFFTSMNVVTSSLAETVNAMKSAIELRSFDARFAVENKQYAFNKV